MRLIVRRQPRGRGAQLAFDDVDGWRFHALITNVPKTFMSAVSVELAHRLRGGAPEEAIRQLKGDFGMNHAPVTGFFGNWLWCLATALAYNVARWLRVLALPRTWHRVRGKRLRLGLLNIPACVVCSARRLYLRLPAAYQHAAVFIAALERIPRYPRSPDRPDFTRSLSTTAGGSLPTTPPTSASGRLGSVTPPPQPPKQRQQPRPADLSARDESHAHTPQRRPERLAAKSGSEPGVPVQSL